MASHLHELGYAPNDESIAIIYTCARTVVEFSGNTAVLLDLESLMKE